VVQPAKRSLVIIVERLMDNRLNRIEVSME
jgi:hypothetical protein